MVSTREETVAPSRRFLLLKVSYQFANRRIVEEDLPLATGLGDQFGKVPQSSTFHHFAGVRIAVRSPFRCES
jgi:hypothetical protein